MIYRVTENMKFNTITDSLFNVQGQSANLMEKISTQKNINRPSDNPIGAGNLLNYNSNLASISQYQTNITDAKTWLSLTDTNISCINDIIAKAKEVAISQSSAVASVSTMSASAANISSLLDNALSLMNAKQGDSYLFGGSETDVEPFSATPSAAVISAASAATANAFNGTVTSGGIYTGTENKTYAVKIISGGTLAASTYKISEDGGKTWGATQSNLAAPIPLGDGITMAFTAGSQALSTDDLFTVNGYTGGYYRGNDDQMAVQIGKNNNFTYNITGSSAFTAANGPVATASLTGGTGNTLTTNGTIMLTRGNSAGSWVLTNHAEYPNMAIASTSANSVTIDTDGAGAGTDIITLSLSGQWSANNTASFSITGGTPGIVGSAVTVHGPRTVDLLTTLSALKTALTAHDTAAVSAQIDDLTNIQTQVLEKQTEAGSKSSSLELTSTSLAAFKEQITSMKSGIEDIDLAKLITSYQMNETALQSAYNLAAKIGKLTIMDYL
jgi:flagellar hook-associated protein 3 FlgL